MISIVCVYNDESVIENYLFKGLRGQTVEFELIKIDNTKNKFKSAAEALNYGGKKAKGNYLMFVHQDVDLSSNSWLEDAEEILNSIHNLGIAGVAGMSEEGETQKDRGRNIIKHGNRMWGLANPIQKPEPVQTLDECLVIIPRSVFNVLRFDEKTCDDWHLYAVDYSLSVKKLGFGVYAIPMFIYHKSTGAVPIIWHRTILSSSLPDSYYRTLRKTIKKHKNHVKELYTTCGCWRTSYPLILQRIVPIINKGKGLIYLLMIKLGFRYLWRKSGLKYLWKQIRKQ